MTRHLYFAVGWVFFGLGALGILLPVLPTTPFMILALWAFSRSSQRFHHWLHHHPLFGPSLHRWEQYRVIPRTAKVFALAMMAASLLYLFLFAEAPLWAKWSALAVMGFGAWFILSKPSRPPEE
jgi:uncharacterized membrane protein YbaN (DUF454 family)